MFLELKLMKIRRKNQKKLNSDNLKEFNYIKSYMSNSTLSFYEREEVLQQILDTMLEAEAENKNIYQFIGKDINSFCNSIIMEYSNSKSLIIKVISFIEQLITFICLWALLDMLFYTSPLFKLTTILNATFTSIFISIMMYNSKNKSITAASFQALVPMFIIMFIIRGLAKGLGINLDMRIRFSSTRYIFAAAIFFIIISQIYKSVINKQKFV